MGSRGLVAPQSDDASTASNCRPPTHASAAAAAAAAADCVVGSHANDCATTANAADRANIALAAAEGADAATADAAATVSIDTADRAAAADVAADGSAVADAAAVNLEERERGGEVVEVKMEEEAVGDNTTTDDGSINGNKAVSGGGNGACMQA